jgi:steroid 5-alpha reductase family enzyme
MNSLLLLTAIAVALLMVGLWLVSLIRRDASIVDITWGLGFAMIALIGALADIGDPYRARLLAFCTVVWGGRLGVYLYFRNRGQGEDFRYQAMRRHWGNKFPVVSLFTVFGLQGVLMWFISLPVQLGQSSLEPNHGTVFDVLGVGLWTVGFLFEAVGDTQLTRFKSDPSNRGKVMDLGLWRYTRHPNYFGDACLWWGIYLIAAATPNGRWAIASPLLMTFLLMRVSGVPLLEKKLTKTRPQYVDYIRRTSSFFPWPPKR